MGSSSSRRRRSRRGAHQDFIFTRISPCTYIVSILVVISVLPMLRHFADGRATPSKQPGLIDPQGLVEEEARIMRSRIGSRPPRCDRRCYSCGHCEAIQVPTNPQVTAGKLAVAGLSRTTVAYSRGDFGGSNYKPMSWKCKCGNSIFNP